MNKGKWYVWQTDGEDKIYYQCEDGKGPFWSYRNDPKTMDFDSVRAMLGYVLSGNRCEHIHITNSAPMPESPQEPAREGRSLGQVAWEWLQGMSWDTQEYRIQEDWEIAANAVREAVLKDAHRELSGSEVSDLVDASPMGADKHVSIRALIRKADEIRRGSK